MGCLIEKLIFKSGVDRVDKKDIPNELWSIEIDDIDGNKRRHMITQVGKKLSF